MPKNLRRNSTPRQDKFFVVSFFFTIKMLMLIIFIVILIILYFWFYSTPKPFKFNLIQPPAFSRGPAKQENEFGYFKFVTDKNIQYVVIANSLTTPTYLKIFSPFEAIYINDPKIIAQIIAKNEITASQLAAGKQVFSNLYSVVYNKPGPNFHIDRYGQVI